MVHYLSFSCLSCYFAGAFAKFQYKNVENYHSLDRNVSDQKFDLHKNKSIYPYCEYSCGKLDVRNKD